VVAHEQRGTGRWQAIDALHLVPEPRLSDGANGIDDDTHKIGVARIEVDCPILQAVLDRGKAPDRLPDAHRAEVLEVLFRDVLAGSLGPLAKPADGGAEGFGLAGQGSNHLSSDHGEMALFHGGTGLASATVTEWGGL
jgi:hypothetical protein